MLYYYDNNLRGIFYMSNNKIKGAAVYLSEDDARAFEKLAEEADRSKSSLLRHWIKEKTGKVEK